jgi:hypothetical protein
MKLHQLNAGDEFFVEHDPKSRYRVLEKLYPPVRLAIEKHDSNYIDHITSEHIAWNLEVQLIK